MKQLVMLFECVNKNNTKFPVAALAEGYGLQEVYSIWQRV